MGNEVFSTKRLAISKNNAQMVGMIAAASFITIFCLVAARALISQQNYQRRVIDKKEAAVKQLKANIAAVQDLEESYTQFNSSAENIIGGNSSGTGDRDGDNAKIVLDALPSKYDFPGLTSSIEKLLTDRNFKINSISGTDDELSQSKTQENTATPEAVPMPFQVSVSSNYQSIQELVGVLERSIRPMQMLTLTLSGEDKDLKLDFDAQTYYQPEKTLTIKTEAVK